ncbi:MAG TPA: ankyrin repeat domain-containing protein [Pyrinomonadaceae bacterium]|nr:ankyrin repeat domain-containing protein [Pyrinomonadaceae bacterium]
MCESDSFDDVLRREQLHFAARDGDLAEVTRLLNEGYQPNVFDELGKTPLHYASERGHLDVMRLLLSSGADVNAHDESVIGDTVLRDVASSCSFEVAKILVDAGADPTIPGWMMLTALHKSAERKKPEGVRVHQLLVEAARRFGPSRTELIGRQRRKQKQR